jgi:hypothetical protein
MKKTANSIKETLTRQPDNRIGLGRYSLRWEIQAGVAGGVAVLASVAAIAMHDKPGHSRPVGNYISIRHSASNENSSSASLTVSNGNDLGAGVESTGPNSSNYLSVPSYDSGNSVTNNNAPLTSDEAASDGVMNYQKTASK